MTIHRDLTGDEVHEPKGIENAPPGRVYVSDGTGSGTWEGLYSGILAVNQYWLTGRMADISAPGNRVFFYVPVRSEITSLTAILHNAITTADSVLEIYINGVLFSENLVVPFATSTVGAVSTKAITTQNTLNPGVVVEIRTNGASDTAAFADIQLGLRAKA